ncbi:hypothetical protein CIG75_02125 [Tumebacillus algifaecis]|uniref:PDZ domain-containing protein n=1 Tax=Tumebacillus algifaecis TaxID=1214604 RepID=A0A223CXG9_9BACL|nr:S41 family peptidase [Tumebacillus algifaecis]ASS73887.1 hypothetical protein CIG75_02125 [Tumebacillus algifaecis]
MRWKPFLISSTLSLALLFGQAGVVAAETVDPQEHTLLELYRLIVDRHYTHPDRDKVLQGAIKGMLEVLQDPFSSYMTPDEYAAFIKALDNQYAGIGTQLNSAKTGEILITEVYDNSPAQRAGLQAGDRILTVDGQAVTGKQIDSVAPLVRGKAGTETVLTIMRGSVGPQTIKVKREEISLPTVTAKDMGNGVGYLRILTFGGNTSREFFTEYDKLIATSPNGILLDLRGNGGGSVLSALEIADHFLTSGTMLVLHDESGETQEIKADELGTDIPVAILVDQHTASASEMLAGALQQNGRAKLIGTQTYGKGTMQEPITLQSGGVLKLSVDAWALGDGSSIQEVGLTPDIRLTFPSVMVNGGLNQLLPKREQTLTLQRSGGSGELNGVRLLDVPALLTKQGQDFLPLRYVVEAFGSEVKWLPEASAVQFSLENQTVRVQLRTGTVSVNDKDLRLQSSEVHVENGVTYLSSRALDLILGGGIQATDRTITIRAD